jgi:signal transduction histidine kinase
MAAGIIGLATGIQLVLQPFLPEPQTLFFYPAVVAAAWLSGLGPGIAATFLATLSIAYLFLPPALSFAISDPRDQLDLSIFAALSFILVVGLDRLRASMSARETAQHAAENASADLDRQRALLEAVVQNAPVGLGFAGTDGVFRLHNDALRAFGDHDVALDNLHDVASRNRLCTKDGRVVAEEEWRGLVRAAEAKVVSCEAQWHTPSQRTAWIHALLAPVRSDDRWLGTVVMLRDVAAEHALEQLREEFAAVIAHDLRGPITSILLPVEQTLRKGTGSEGAVSVPTALLERVQRGAERLNHLVGDLLEASRVEMRRMELDRKDADLGHLVTELVDDLRPTLRDHPVVTDLPPQPVVASVDQARLGRVVTNLLDNAAKYSPPESTIRVELRRSDGGAEFAVADQGKGIDPDDVPKLFDRFFQAQRAREHKEGLGLGLYIAKGIVDAHGGRLSVDSRPGNGSTFRVWLPIG